jgi:hypothetical protein
MCIKLGLPFNNDPIEIRQALFEAHACVPKNTVLVEMVPTLGIDFRKLGHCRLLSAAFKNGVALASDAVVLGDAELLLQLLQKQFHLA